MVDKKRRLPVLNSPSAAAEEEDDRPPWHWSGFGAAAIFAAWLPLAYVAEGLRARLFRSILSQVDAPADVAAALAGLSESERSRLMAASLFLHAVPLVVGSLAGGYLVGRYGGKAGVREAAVAGVAVAFVVVVLTWSAAGWSWPPLVAFALVPPIAAAGGAFGLKKRPHLGLRT